MLSLGHLDLKLFVLIFHLGEVQDLRTIVTLEIGIHTHKKKMLTGFEEFVVVIKIAFPFLTGQFDPHRNE